MNSSDLVFTSLWKPPVPYQQSARGYHVAVGPSEFSFWALSSLCPALAAGAQIYWVDGINRFDAYGVGRAAQALGLPPRVVLSHIQLARPFSAFQMDSLVSTKLRRMSAHIPVIISDPMALFYDAELSEEDAQRTFRSFLKHLKELPMTVLALAVKRDPPMLRRSFSKQLAQDARAISYLDVSHGPWMLETKLSKIRTPLAA